MKKILLVSVLASAILFGQEHVNPERMKNMAEMETAMATIQKGFLFNNLSVVKNGVKDLKRTALHTESFIKEGVTKDGFNTLIYAQKQAKDISEMGDNIEGFFARGDKYSSANEYLKILSKCLSCHQTIRSW